MIKSVDNCLWCNGTDLKKIATRKDGVGIVECQSCGLDMVDEIPENLDEYYYSEEYYNAGETNIGTGYADIYDLMAPAFLLWQNSVVESLNEVHAKKTFLEIGCATGNLLEIMRKFQPNLELKGIDVSKYAAGVARHKGFDVDVAYIENYQPKQPIDIIFSSETLEHLDNLKSFLEGVKKNLSKNGVFVFYVPSIQRDAAIAEGAEYVRFTHNFEHLLHFTPEFMKKEIPRFFKKEGVIEEFVTDFGPCIVGAVSNNKSALTNFNILLSAIQNNALPKDSTSHMLKNIATMAMKFGKEELATNALGALARSKDNLADDALVLKAMAGYHAGRLHESNAALLDYLSQNPGDTFAIRSLLANEIELDKIYRAQIDDLSTQKSALESRVFLAETELTGIRNSRVPGTVLKVMIRVGKIKASIRYALLSVRDRLKAVARRPFPSRIRSFLERTKTKILTRKRILNNTIHKGPLVSVVIPYYNRQDTIDETLGSLKTQTFSNFEVILVDDGSPSKEAREKLLHLDTSGLNFTLLQQENAGVASARNYGIKNAKGRYIVCLDSDDMLDPTYIEKGVVVLETDANTDIYATDMRLFGVQNLVYSQGAYNALELMRNNMIHTAAMYRKVAWEDAGGYKSEIGYEDWEFWINMAERGHMGRVVPEPLFQYRTAVNSRYVEDRSKHSDNLRLIAKLHGNFRRSVRRALFTWKYRPKVYQDNTRYINLNTKKSYRAKDGQKPEVLLLLPWMTFGGAETLIYNFSRELSKDFNLSYMTGLGSVHEWEWKFKEISPRIYHLANMFKEDGDYTDYISNYITVHNVKILHIVHTGFVFTLLEEIKRRHPKIKVVVTMFNDRAGHFLQSLDAVSYIDIFTTDNTPVKEHYAAALQVKKEVVCIPNGVNCFNEFNPTQYDSQMIRKTLGLSDGDIAVFYIGRLSIEKNPDIFLEAARVFADRKNRQNVKFFIVGDGPMRSHCEKIIEKHNLTNVTYLGYRNEIAELLAAADIFILPSEIEGFPLSILEAMAMRTAIIASRVGAIPDVIEEGINGLLVKPGAASEVIFSIEKIIEDGTLEEIKNNNRQKAENTYSNIELGKRYAKLYRNALK